MVVSNASDEFKNLFEKKYNQIEFSAGKVVNGKVASVLRDYVIINIGFKSEGYINIEEFRNLDGEIVVNPGEDVQVVIEDIEDDEGNLVLSKERADAIKAWGHVESVFKEDGIIDGLVVNKVKGGLSINLGGIKAFLPGSQIDLKPVKSLDKLIGRKLPFKILKLNQEKGNIVLSRRVLLEQERETLKRDILENIKEGQVIHGTVKNITDYGAFVDLGGIDGLLHITDMTWGRLNHPSEVFKVNDEIDVVVLKYDAEKEKVSLGYKQLQEDPWEKNADQFKSGEKVKGRVVSLADYGAFIEVYPGIEGLVHVSELSWSKKVKHPNKILKVGDTVEALILDVDKDNRKMALGLKQLEPNPWDILHQKYPVGSRVAGKIRNITDFGIFVGIDEEDIDGLVHVSDISWDKAYKWPNEDYKKGQDVEVVVLNIDRDNKKFSLGIKQLSDNPFAIMMRAFPLGMEVNGKIEDVSDKGLVFRIDDKTTGFVPAAETGVQKSKVRENFNVGDEISAQVKKYDDRDRRMIASIKTLERRQEKDNMKDFLNKQGDASVTLSDLMK
jgi:small subunit ribosomal protein S1